jgi:ubiquinone/menaquinone biosynthesis C-methylase UbiE
MKVSTATEREFEKKHVRAKRERLLETNSVSRYQTDEGYKAKIDFLKDFLIRKAGDGYVLDLGANTAGESENLFHQGYKMVPVDINEEALSISKIRSKHFRNEELTYYGADARNLPFSDNLFQCVIAYDTLHHMENPDQVLAEIFRVLQPGGHLLTVDPFAYNLYRRLLEIPYLFKGSIEKSFTKEQLIKYLSRNQLENIEIGMCVFPPSTWKMEGMSSLRIRLKYFYFALGQTLHFLGSIYSVSQKPGESSSSDQLIIDDNLQCPITLTKLIKEGNGYVSTNLEGSKYSYPIVDEIPVLIKEDAERLS